MGQLGELFPGAQLRKDTPEDAGNGQRFEPGPVDLDSGMIHLSPRSTAPAREQAEEESAD